MLFDNQNSLRARLRDTRQESLDKLEKGHFESIIQEEFNSFWKDLEERLFQVAKGLGKETWIEYKAAFISRICKRISPECVTEKLSDKIADRGLALIKERAKREDLDCREDGNIVIISWY